MVTFGRAGGDRVHPKALAGDQAVPDLHTQLEEILNTVWEAESWARLDARIELALRLEARRQAATAFEGSA